MSDGYEVCVSREGSTFVLTNTFKDPKPNTSSDDSTPQFLPQTGQMWWSVPTLLCLGMICGIVGMILRKKEKENE